MGKFNFKRKVVVITGGAGGIGRALALRCVQAGARVVCLDLDLVQLEAIKNQLEKVAAGASVYQCDITDHHAVQDTFNKVLHEYGGIDVLVNNAGITHRSAFTETELEVFDRVMAVNFFGALYCTKKALPSLIKQRGMIITLSSMSGFAPLWYRSGYNASKHALHGLFESLRLELQDQQVHVMLVCPGYTATDFNKKALLGDGSIAETNQKTESIMKSSSPQTVAASIYKGAIKRKRLMILSNIGKGTRLMAWLWPEFYEHFLAQHMSRSQLESTKK